MPEKKMAIPHIRTTFTASTTVIHSKEAMQPEDVEEDELILLFAEDLGINVSTNEEITPPICLYQPGEVAGS